MKFTTVSIKEIQADKTHRLDAKYWIKKNKKRIRSQARKRVGPPVKNQAASLQA
jgi:hypothetical protein